MSAPQNAKVIGVDLGGTNVRAAVISASGAIIERRRAATPYESGVFGPPMRLVEAVASCVRPLIDAHPECKAVGVGSAGQFNPITGRCLGINTRDPQFVDFPMSELLADALNTEVCIDNDVKMAAYSELKLGAGRGRSNWLFVAVGTGIGGALILGGQLYHGMSGLAGHLGLFPDPQSGDHIESIAGGVPLCRGAQKQGIIAPHETTETLFEQARAGDTVAADFISAGASALGRVLAGLAHTLEPELILMGGSVGIQPEYLAAVAAALQSTVLPAWRPVRVAPAQLGTDAGLIGAGLCAIERFYAGV